MIVFLECNTNNRATTVMRLFQHAVNVFGLPPRVRSDKGGENVMAALYMLNHPLRGPDRGSHSRMQCAQSVNRKVVEGFVHWLYFCFLQSVSLHGEMHYS